MLLLREEINLSSLEDVVTACFKEVVAAKDKVEKFKVKILLF